MYVCVYIYIYIYIYIHVRLKDGAFAGCTCEVFDAETTPRSSVAMRVHNNADDYNHNITNTIHDHE